jgi:hypothetical protein
LLPPARADDIARHVGSTLRHGSIDSSCLACSSMGRAGPIQHINGCPGNPSTDGIHTKDQERSSEIQIAFLTACPNGLRRFPEVVGSPERR